MICYDMIYLLTAIG